MAPDLAAVLAQARPVLARLELVQHGGTMNLSPTKGSHNADSALVPQGEANPPHLVHRERILEAPTPEAANAALDDARDELRHATRRTLVVVREETLADLKARIIDEGAGWTPREVSIAMRCTERLVRVARTEANRHPETGYGLPPEGVDVWAWARELRAQGLSLRQVALVTGLARSTLHDRL
jgi:hypothetical protein